MSALSLGNPETAYAHNPKPDRTQSFVSFQMPAALEAFIKSLLLLGFFFLLLLLVAAVYLFSNGDSRVNYAVRTFSGHIIPICRSILRWRGGSSLWPACYRK
jgi:hypothetical protein